ncbi:MAG: hypothetical protein WCJ48_06090, partial [Actinomycetes bacterium]
ANAVITFGAGEALAFAKTSLLLPSEEIVGQSMMRAWRGWEAGGVFPRTVRPASVAANNTAGFGPRLGPKGVVPGRHNANVTVRDASGNIVHHERVVSGGMTPVQKELGFPLSSNATHTEAQAVMNTSIPSGSGFNMTITGQRAPCPSCKNYMQLHYENTGTPVQYQWRENGSTQLWNTGP